MKNQRWFDVRSAATGEGAALARVRRTERSEPIRLSPFADDSGGGALRDYLEKAGWGGDDGALPSGNEWRRALHRIFMRIAFLLN